MTIYLLKWPNCSILREAATAGETVSFDPMQVAYCTDKVTQKLNPYFEMFELWPTFMMMMCPMNLGVAIVYLLKYMWAGFFVVKYEIEEVTEHTDAWF